MKTAHYAIAAILLFVSGAGVIGFTSSQLLPDVVAAQSALHPVVQHDTVTITDTVTPKKTERSVISVFFASGSAAIPASEMERLIATVKSSGINDASILKLDGYSDPTGTGTIDNNYLASQRNFAVYNLLIRNGIAKKSIFMRSFGAISDSSQNIDSIRKVDISLSEELH